MHLNVSYYPPKRAAFGTGSEATHPFYLEDEIPYIVEIRHCDTQRLIELCMTELNGLDNYPIYSLAEFYDEEQEEIQEQLQKDNIQFEFFSGNKKIRFM